LTYFTPVFTHRPYQNFEFFPNQKANNCGFSLSVEGRVDFATFATDAIPNKDLFLPNAAQFLPLYRYTSTGERVDNITDWGLKRFREHYGKGEKITKEDIFHYVYGVLHDPVYREKYALNLKREFPRVPFYPDFWTWADWGRRLMDLHIGYETVEPWPLQRLDTAD
jgi:predicted helicase